MADGSASLEQEFRAALGRHVTGSRIGVAVSGGGDSMALLDLAHLTCPGRLAAATVNHGMRPEARDEAAMVAEYCARLEIPHETLALAPLPDHGNLSANLRDGRYQALADWAKKVGAETVLLGHTMDDQAETVLMRLARGSGVEGLSGMETVREAHRVRWVRPMLGMRRENLRAWLRARNISWVDDPTNEDPSFDRVKARTALAALEPLGIHIEGLSQTAHRMRRQRAVLEAALRELAQDARRIGADGSCALSREALTSAVQDTALRLLADTLMQVGGQSYRPRFRALSALFQRVEAREIFRATLAGCLIEAKETDLVIKPEHSESAP